MLLNCWVASSNLSIYRKLLSTLVKQPQFTEWWERFFFSDLKTINAVLNAESFTLVFDAMTQGRNHVSYIILTIPASSHLVTQGRLPGRAAQDYKQYISECISNLAEICAYLLA